MRTSGGVSWTWLRAVVATVLVGSALVLNPGGAASETGTADDTATELDAELAFAEQILDVAQNPDVEPSQRAIDTARMALDHRRGQIDAEPLPLLDQQARNLDTAEELLALGDPDEENALEYGIAAAKVATGHQAGTLGLDLESVEIEAPESDSPSEAALALVSHAEGEVTGSQLAELQTLDALPEPAQVALTDFIDAFIGFSIATDIAYADADMTRIEALLDVMDDPEAVLDLVDSVQPRELLADLGIDFTPVFAARNALLDTVEPLRDALLDPEVQQQQSAAVPIQFHPFFSIDLATTGNNTYSRDFILLLDAGGNDTYKNNAGGGVVRLDVSPVDRCALPGFASATLWRAATLLDLGGDDLYTSGLSCGVNGGGFAGSGFLADLGGGSDAYAGGNSGTNGGGSLGTGFLIDRGGTDSYTGGNNGTNGGGSLGTGFLIDGAGTDRYTATSNGTNGGGFLGSGTLLELGGNDRYSAASRGTNGGGNVGAGLIIDLSGGDDYVAQTGIFGVNGGGALGSGALMDASGNDSYTAQSDGVNGGVTSGTGLLLDVQGNDNYSDADGGTGTNKSVIPKGLVGAQVDSDSASPVPTTVPTLPPTTLPVPTTLPTVPPTTLPVPTTLPTVTTSTLPPPPPLPTTTTSSSTTTTSTTTSTTTTSSTTTTTTPPPPGGGSNVGAGGFTGSVAFDPPGLPPILAPCAPTTFSFDGEAEAFVLNTTIVGYAGPVTFTGGGSSECENATGGSGSLTLSAEGEGPTGSTIVCDTLTGDFSRFFVRAQINLTGDCTINGISTTGILFTADVLVAADGAGSGITDPVMLARFAGDFAVSPG